MTREEAIKIFQRMKKIRSVPNSDAERTKEAIDMAIEALLTDIVRCKDCKHMKYAIDKGKNGICAELGALIIMNGNDYCSCGERKEEWQEG